MKQETKGRALDCLWWLAPIALLVLVFQDGLRCWFSADDFAWLGLLRQVSSPHDILPILFAPAAQGTIRPWSERGFFLLFESLFGLDSLPFRIMDFLTMSANLLLVAWITRRITHSKLAGCIAAAGWASNAALMVVMTWSSAYNEALCSLFLLSALALFIRYSETGKRKFWWWQLVVFSLGFGALELNIVYPALAAAWVLFIAPAAARRKLLLGLIPLFAISVAYFLIHRAVAPLPSTGEYVLHFDARILRTFILYCKWSLLPVVWEAWGHSRRLGKLIVLIEVLGLAALFVAEFRRRRPTILFFVAWFVIALAPVLPLPDHHTDYYVTIPLVGLAMLAAWGVTCASRTAGNWRYVAVLPVVCWIAANIPVARSSTRWSLDRSRSIRAVVLGVEAAYEAHPGKTILLDNIPQGVYEDSIAQGAFYPLSIDNVYLTAKSGLTLKPPPDTADLDRTVLEPAAEIHAIQNDQIVVYSIAGDHLRNITERYERSAPNRLSIGCRLELTSVIPCIRGC